MAWTPARSRPWTVRLRPPILQVVRVAPIIRKKYMVLTRIAVPLVATILRGGTLSMSLTMPTPWLTWLTIGTTTPRLGPRAPAQWLKCLMAYRQFRGIIPKFTNRTVIIRLRKSKSMSLARTKSFHLTNEGVGSSAVVRFRSGYVPSRPSPRCDL